MTDWPPSIGIKPYYSDTATVIFCADCLTILPLLPKVDLVLKTHLENSTVSGKFRDAKDKTRTEKAYGVRGALDPKEIRDPLALSGSEMVDSGNRRLLQGVSDLPRESDETVGDSVQGQRQGRSRERALQGRESKQALPTNDPEGQVLALFNNGISRDSSQELRSLRQPFGESASSMRLVSLPTSQNGVVETPEIALITDPPYGLKFADCVKNSYVSFDDDPETVLDLVIPILLRGFTRAAITPGQNLMFRYPEPDSIGVFYYPAGCGSSSWGFVGWQPIFFYGKDPYLQHGQGRRINCKVSTESAEKNGHPCPKPLGAWKWLVDRASAPGDLIIDPFMGSGTTLRAAKDLGRKAIGIEIEERYCEIAARRLAQEVLPLDTPPEPRCAITPGLNLGD